MGGSTHEVAMTGTQVCKWCLETKDVTEFYVQRSRASGRDSACKACMREYTQSGRPWQRGRAP